MKKFFIQVTKGIWFCSGITLFFSDGHAQGKFSGYMFGDYFYQVAHDSANVSLKYAAVGSTPKGQSPKGYQAFQFRRIYFTYDNDISGQFTTRFRLEADQEANTSNGKIGIFVKDAYVKWKNIFEGSDLYFGIQPPPSFDISENAWGYRSLEKTIMDLRGIASSRDQGVALRGKIDRKGIFNYWAMLANGSGNKPESDRYKRYYLNLQVKPIDKLQITVYTDYLARAKTTDIYQLKMVPNGTLTYAGFVGYREPDKLNVGVEVFLSSTDHGYKNTAASAFQSLDATGVSFFASFYLNPEAAIVARYDIYDPNTAGSSKGDSRNYFLGGFAWKPNQNVSIIPNIQIESYEKPQNGKSIDSSVTGRLTFYYVFL